MCGVCRPFYEAFTDIPKVRCSRTDVFANMGLFPAAQMGVGEGKSIGQWYGPNTVAQVLKYVMSPALLLLGVSMSSPWHLPTP